MKRRTKISFFLLAMSACISALVFPVSAEEENEVVKVAWFDMGEYYQKQANGTICSYDSTMLSKIAEVTDLSFEYVDCGTWANALTMLDAHEVDLVGTVQWTAERESQYEFCLESYGYTVGELAVLADSTMVYEDYAAFGNSVIGTTETYVRRPELDTLLRTHGISPTIRTYEGQTELEQALESGEVDLVAANSHTLRSDWRVVEKFSYAPFYLISWKGNHALTDKIDSAIISIALENPSYDDELMMEFFPSIVGSPLTKAELDLIAQENIYNVYLEANTKPTSWVDPKTGELQGSLVEMCKEIQTKTGLQLKPVVRDGSSLPGNGIATTTIFLGDHTDLETAPNITNPLVEETFNLYYKDGTRLDPYTSPVTISVVKNRAALKKYLISVYPKATFQEYDSPKDCIKAVEQGEVDLTYLDTRIAENAIQENGIKGVREFPIEPTSQGIAFEVGDSPDLDLVVSILNKGIAQVDEDLIARYYVEVALDTNEPVTFETLVRDHLGWVLIAGTTFVILLILAAIAVTYANVMRRQKDKIARADADKSEFFARMSHDMRTPMNGVLGMIRISNTSKDVDEIHENLHKAEAAGEYMLSLINDTLDLQRIESKKLKLEKNVVQVTDYYDSIFSIMKVSAEQKGLDFRVHYVGIRMENYIEIDAVRLKQILSNLISNAIKFTPRSGAVDITVASTGQDGNRLHRKYVIKDTGVGMSQDFIQHRLFKPYSQENNELSSQLTGSGLGMAITKNLVELMGGKLEVESAIGEGTTFTVYLDLLQANAEDVQQAENERQAQANVVTSELQGKTILLCEDHPLNAEITIRLLDQVGCTTVWKENGQLGLEEFEHSTPGAYDAILMDIRMPVMDGLTATRAIRACAHPDAKTIPILAMTANAYESDIHNCMDAGMNAHMAKPIEPKVLYQKLYQVTHSTPRA